MFMGQPRFCSASGMFTEARVNCFYTMIYIRSRWIRTSSNGILSMIANRLDCSWITVPQFTYVKLISGVLLLPLCCLFVCVDVHTCVLTLVHFVFAAVKASYVYNIIKLSRCWWCCLGGVVHVWEGSDILSHGDREEMLCICSEMPPRSSNRILSVFSDRWNFPLLRICIIELHAVI